MKQFIISSLWLDFRHLDSKTSLCRSLHRLLAVLFVSLVLTLDSFVLGLVFALLTWIGAIDGRSRWSMLGTILIVAVFPLLMLTAHCMDEIDAAGEAVRKQYFRENNPFFDDLI